MKIEKSVIGLLLVLGLACVTRIAAQTVDGGTVVNLGPNNTLTDAEVKDGYKLLWNGKDFTGWKTWQSSSPGTNWTIVAEKGVENGAKKSLNADSNVIEVTSSGESIWTADTTLQDFDWMVEWLTPGDVAENSGLLIRYSEATGKNNNQSAPEYQICNSKWAEWTDSTTTTGTDYYIYPLLKSRRNQDYSPTWTRAAGHWNQSRIIAYKGRVAHYGNGLKLVEYNMLSADWKTRFNKSKYSGYPYYATIHPGSIFIQDHGQPNIKFRNIRFKRLTENPWGPTSPYVDKNAVGDTSLVDALSFAQTLFPIGVSGISPFAIQPKPAGQAKIVSDRQGISVLFSERGDYSLKLRDMRGVTTSENTVQGSDRFFLPVQASSQPRVLSIWKSGRPVQESLIESR